RASELCASGEPSSSHTYTHTHAHTHSHTHTHTRTHTHTHTILGLENKTLPFFAHTFMHTLQHPPPSHTLEDQEVLKSPFRVQQLFWAGSVGAEVWQPVTGAGRLF